MVEAKRCVLRGKQRWKHRPFALAVSLFLASPTPRHRRPPPPTPAPTAARSRRSCRRSFRRRRRTRTRRRFARRSRRARRRWSTRSVRFAARSAVRSAVHRPPPCVRRPQAHGHAHGAADCVQLPLEVRSKTCCDTELFVARPGARLSTGTRRVSATSP